MRVPVPAGEHPAPLPFEVIPFELAESCDEVLDEDKAAETMWEGWHVLLASDTFLAEAALREPNTEQDLDRAWKIQRADGRWCYLWIVRRGGYGLGKAKRNGTRGR